MNQPLSVHYLRGWQLALPLYLLFSLTTSWGQTGVWPGWTVQQAAPTQHFTSITYGNGHYVAVLDRGENKFYIYTSPDGQNWTSGPFALGDASIASQPGWQSIAFGGGQFTAIRPYNYPGGYPPVMWNRAETTWIGSAFEAQATNKNWTAITYGDDQFVGISTEGSVLISPGKDVFTYYTTLANGWSSLTYGNGLYVAVASSGSTDKVITSPDGITWTVRTAAASNTWNSVTYGNGLFVAVASSGSGNRVMTSPDGITWTSRTAAADNEWSEVTYGGGQFVAVASSGVGNRVMTSPDGITWTAHAAASDNDWASVTYGDGQYVAVATNGDYKRFMTSADGITWTGYTGNYSSVWSDVTYGNGQFVAVDPKYDKSMTSPDAITWTTHKATNIGARVDYGNGLFVSIGNTPITAVNNNVITSPDGITWTVRPSLMTNLLGLTFANGLFVVVGENGVMTSPDGLNWTIRDDERGLISVVYGEGLYVAIATNGVVTTSPDGITWTQRKGATQEYGQQWRSIGYGNGTFIAVADIGNWTSNNLPNLPNQVLTSPDGITWTARKAPQPYSQWSSITFGNGLFVAIAAESFDNNPILTMTSRDGITWTNQNTPNLNYWYSITYARGLYLAVAAGSSYGARNMVLTAGCLRPLVSITANPSLTITQGSSATLTASGATSYGWSNGKTTAAISVSVAGTYSVTGTTGGCSSVTSVVVAINNSLPTIANFRADSDPICQGKAVVFSATIGNVTGTYDYTLTNGSQTASGTNNTASFAQSVTTISAGVQTFTLTVRSNGQSAGASTNITVNSLPTVSIVSSSTTLTKASPSMSLTAVGTGTYLWSTGATTQVISVSASGTYSVTLTSSSGCTASSSVPVAGSDLTVTLELPGASFAAAGTVGNFVVKVFEVAGLPTSSGNVTITVTAPVGYTLSFASSLTSIAVTGGTSTTVSNGQWTVTNSLASRQLTLTMNSGAFISGEGESSLGLSIIRTTASSGSVSNITVNVADDLTMSYDANQSNNGYARIISGL